MKGDEQAVHWRMSFLKVERCAVIVATDSYPGDEVDADLG